MKKYNNAYKSAIGLALAAAFLLIWMNLGVGIIGDSDDPANLMYVGVLAVGLVGAVIARFQSHGMARALFATACAQALVPLIALGAGMHLDGRTPPVGMFLIMHLFFVVLFVGSAWLFRCASRGKLPSVSEG